MAFSFSGSTSDLRSELQKIDPSVKDVTRVDGNFKVTYNNGFTRTLSKEGVNQLRNLYQIPTGQYDYDSETGNRLGEQYIYDYRLVKPEDIAKADINYVAPQAGFDPSTYNITSSKAGMGSGAGLGKLQELLDLGASRQQIVDIFKTAPIIGNRMEQLFPELRGVDINDPYAPVSGLNPEQLASYDVSTGIGMTKLEDLLNLGATPEQIAEIASRSPLIGSRLQTLFPQVSPYVPPPPTFSPNVPAFNYNVPSFNYGAPSAGLPALVPVSPVSLVQAAEAPTLSPSVQTIAGMKEGGLAAAARQVASAGRGGDTMLAHVTPEEAGILKALGGAGTINPKTGLPEYFKVFGIDLFPKKGITANLGPLGKIKIGRKSSDLLLAAAAGYAGSAGYLGLTPATAAVAYGGVRALATGNLQEGIMAGLSAYGMGEGFQAAGVGGNAAGSAGSAGSGTGSLAGGPAGVEAGVVPVGGEAAIPPVGVESVPATVPTATGADMGFNVANAPGAGFSYPEGSFAYDAGGGMIPPGAGEVLPADATVAQQMAYTPTPEYIRQATAPATASTAPDGFLAETLPAGVQEYIPDPLLNASGTTLAAGAVLAPGLVSGQQERQAYARQQAALRAEEEEKKRRYRELFESTLGAVPTRMARSGGLMSLAGGGMTYMEAGGTTGPTGIPREVTGTGDGMSDSVPATIEGVQEARLADGEFVIPADVVADIGNGSSDAGSKKLYDMMDRIREARHGTTKQPPEIDAEALMPA